MTFTDDLFRVSAGIETRWASPENPEGAKGAGGQSNGGRKGRAHVPIPAGGSLVLAHASGVSGVLRRIWLTLSERDAVALRGLRFECYWDGAAVPAVSAPLGDFFCQSLGRMTRMENVFFSSPEARSFNCIVPMPFRNEMKIVIWNDSDREIRRIYYDIDYTIGDPHDDEVLSFHSLWRRENPTGLQRDFEFLPRILGKGRFLGVNFGVTADKSQYYGSWWGEGEVKFFVDGDTEFATLVGTGTEDYIGSGWEQGTYANLYQGCPLADHEQMQFGFYRFHVPDPVFFHRDIRATMQQIGCWNPQSRRDMAYAKTKLFDMAPGLTQVDLSKDSGLRDYGFFERQDDWCSCCYFYLDRPEGVTTEFAPLALRIEAPFG